MLFENYNSIVLEPFEATGDEDLTELTILRQRHTAYLLRYLKNCPSSYAVSSPRKFAFSHYQNYLRLWTQVAHGCATGL